MSVTPDPTIGAHLPIPADPGPELIEPAPEPAGSIAGQTTDQTGDDHGDGEDRQTIVLTTDVEAQTDDPLINPNNS